MKTQITKEKTSERNARLARIAMMDKATSILIEVENSLPEKSLWKKEIHKIAIQIRVANDSINRKW